jgi:hypothetical protein
MPKLRKPTVAEVNSGRDVKFDTISSDVCTGDTAITVDDAKEILGWEETSEGNYVREIYTLAKLKVLCKNNLTNRPLYKNVVQTLQQEILQGRWRMNGEPIIVGQTGLLLNGQHTLIALILANVRWGQDKEAYEENWTTPPTIDKVVVSGVDEGDDTVNTMDTCKPRSLADVIYRSEYFASLPHGERKNASRMADHAIRLLWHRTGAKYDAFAQRKTHSESLDFLDRHPKLLECIKHIHEEDGEGAISRYVGPGYAAGLLYLMGSSKSDPEPYRGSAHPSEESLDWSAWTRACDFFVLLAAGGKDVSAVRRTIANRMEQGSLTMAERWAILTNAWLAYSDGEPITEKSLKLSYTEKDGVTLLEEQPSVGGIDLGDPDTVDEDQVPMRDPKPEEIAEGKKKLKGDDKTGTQKPRAVKLFAPGKAGANWAKGDVAWVRDPDGEHYLGQLAEDPWDCDDSQCRVTVRTAKGEEWEVLYSDLSLEKPNGVQPTAKKTKPKAKVNEWCLGDHPWVVEPGKETWRGAIVEMSKNAAKIKVDSGFQGSSTVRVVAMKHLARKQPTP